MGDERRKSERIEAQSAGLSLVNSVDGQEIGIVGNISTGGMMLISSRELFEDGVLQVNLEALPNGVGVDSVSCGVKVLWSAPANSPSEYWAGLEIIDISKSDQDGLNRLIDHLIQHDD
jgi:hypothetical protein